MANDTPGLLIISSPLFENGQDIPAKFTCEGDGVNPPLTIAGVPDGTQSLAIIVEDPDAPKGTFDHWLLWNIPPETITVKEDSIPGISGKNGTGKTGYHGPCPPSGSHRYYFYVFAVDINLDLDAGSDKQALQAAMETHILAKGSLMGKYAKGGER